MSDSGELRGGPPALSGREWAASVGLYPRIAQFGKIRWVGYYELPFIEDVTVAEFIVRTPWWMIDLHEWWPYIPPGESEEWGKGLADFYLSKDGTELIGSFLQPPPIEQTTRFALVIHRHRLPELVYQERLREPKEKPIPERLLRLIWIEA
jgi:hypothetical protein